MSASNKEILQRLITNGAGKIERRSAGSYTAGYWAVDTWINSEPYCIKNDFLRNMATAQIFYDSKSNLQDVMGEWSRGDMLFDINSFSSIISFASGKLREELSSHKLSILEPGHYFANKQVNEFYNNEVYFDGLARENPKMLDKTVLEIFERSKMSDSNYQEQSFKNSIYIDAMCKLSRQVAKNDIENHFISLLEYEEDVAPLVIFLMRKDVQLFLLDASEYFIKKVKNHLIGHFRHEEFYEKMFNYRLSTGR